LWRQAELARPNCQPDSGSRDDHASEDYEFLNAYERLIAPQNASEANQQIRSQQKG
jgi:hypothetical protein